MCFKALLTQDPFDPICLGFEVRIKENELGLIKGFRLDSLEVEDLPFLSPPSLGFQFHGHLSFLLGLEAMFPL